MKLKNISMKNKALMLISISVLIFFLSITESYAQKYEACKAILALNGATPHIVDDEYLAKFKETLGKKEGDADFNNQADFDNSGQVDDEDSHKFSSFYGQYCNHPPMPASNAITNAAEDVTYNYQFMATDVDYDTLTYILITKPEGMSIDTSTGIISWKPSYNQAGSHNVVVQASDGEFTAQQNFTIKVENMNRPPSFSFTGSKTVNEGQLLQFDILATDPDGDTLTYLSDNLPKGATLSGNKFSWTPDYTQSGAYDIRFVVLDGKGALALQNVLTLVNNANRAPVITSSPITTAILNEKYTYAVQAIDLDNETLKFSLSTDASGILIGNSSGQINFTPSSIGVFNVNISVTDGRDITNQSYTLTVMQRMPLKITEVEIKIDDKKSILSSNEKIGKEAKPGSNVELKINIKNDFSKDEDIKIEDISVTAKIEGIDNDNDLEDESGEFSLKAQASKTVRLKFIVPLDAEEDTFDVSIDAEGRDENGTLHKQVFLTKLEVEKKSHDLRFLTLELSPSVMKCSKTANINYGIINLGQEDEKNAAVEIKNSDLNLDLMESGILINSGAEDNLFAKTASFKISENVENKEYPITASLYSGDNLYDTAAATLKVEECGKNMASIKKSSFYPLELDQSIDGNSVKGETQDSKAKMSSAESSSQDDDRNRRLLVISTLVFVNFFVFGRS